MPYKPPVRPIIGTAPKKAKKKPAPPSGAGPSVDPFSIGGTVLNRPLTPIGNPASLVPPGRPRSNTPHDLPVNAPRPVRAKPVVKAAPVVKKKGPRAVKPVVPATSEKPTVPAVPVQAVAPMKPAATGGGRKAKAKPRQPAASAPQGTAQDQVQQLVNSILNPQLNILNEQAKQQNAAIQQGALALIRELNGMTPVDYQGGADQVAQLAALSSSALANANPNQQDQQLLQAINAPVAQQQQVQNQLANVFGGGAATLFQTAGRIPAQSIIEQGLAGQTYDRLLPGINALQSQQSLRNALYNQATKRQDVLGQVPKLRLDIQNALADQAAKQQQLDIERQAFGLKAQDQAFDQNLAVAKLKQGNYRLNLSKLQADRNYQLGLDRLGISDANLRLRAASLDAKARTSAKKGGLTANKKIQLKGIASTLADNAYHGFSTVEKDGTATEHPPIDYQTAIREAFKEGIPLAIILPALDRYYRKGERGRPWLSFYERQARK